MCVRARAKAGAASLARCSEGAPRTSMARKSSPAPGSALSGSHCVTISFSCTMRSCLSFLRILISRTSESGRPCVSERMRIFFNATCARDRPGRAPRAVTRKRARSLRAPSCACAMPMCLPFASSACIGLCRPVRTSLRRSAGQSSIDHLRDMSRSGSSRRGRCAAPPRGPRAVLAVARLGLSL